jgi:hypothetical protein
MTLLISMRCFSPCPPVALASGIGRFDRRDPPRMTSWKFSYTFRDCESSAAPPSFATSRVSEGGATPLLGASFHIIVSTKTNLTVTQTTWILCGKCFFDLSITITHNKTLLVEKKLCLPGSWESFSRML